MGNQDCRDALLWIGQSYAQILCDHNPDLFARNCYTENKKPKRCYVHEANMRGCSRKIPRAPDWLVPQKSRLFLIHRDGHEVDQGSIFGYFTLHRFERIVSARVDEAFTDEHKIPWIEEVCQEIIAETLELVAEKALDVLLDDHRRVIMHKVRHEFDKRWVDGVGRQISEGGCISPKPARGEPFVWPPKDAAAQDTLPDLLEDILEDMIKDWVENQVKNLVDPPADQGLRRRQAISGSRGSIDIPLDRSLFEEPRYCSKRLKVGAIYVVDALTAAITDAFTQQIKQKRPSTMQQGEKLFGEVMQQVRQSYPEGSLTKIDPRLEGFASLYGELVVFNKPFPIFTRKPRADFRGLLCVDGVKLLDEIAEFYHQPDQQKEFDIPLQGVRAESILDPVYMATTLGINKRMAEAILVLYRQHLAALQIGEVLEISEIGKIHRAADGYTFEPLVSPLAAG